MWSRTSVDANRALARALAGQLNRMLGTRLAQHQAGSMKGALAVRTENRQVDRFADAKIIGNEDAPVMRRGFYRLCFPMQG